MSDGEDQRFEDFLRGEIRQMRYDLSTLQRDVGELRSVNENLNLNDRVTQLEKMRWAVPASAVLAIAISLVGGFA